MNQTDLSPTDEPRAADGPDASVVVFAVILFGLGLRSGVAANLAVITGTLALAFSLRNGEAASSSRSGGQIDLILLTGVLVFCGAIAAGWAPRGIGPTSTALEILPALVWGALALYVYWRSRLLENRTVRILLVAVILGFTTILGISYITATDGVGLDVLELHSQAADAIAGGQSPYSDAVSVENGAPTAQPGDMIEGYVYPPVTAVGFAAGEWAFGEPRYVGLAAWLAFLWILAVDAIRSPDRRPLLVLLLASSAPGWPLILRAAWTEPLSLVFLALGYLLWTRPAKSGVWLGIGLASKQYFAVVAPLLLAVRTRGWRRRAVWAIAAVLLTLVPVLWWGSSEFWRAAVEFHLTTPPRPDSLNLVGLAADLGIAVDIPSLLPMAVGLAVAAFGAMRARNRSQWVAYLALSLAASFLFSSQAFPNYWFLVMGLGILAINGAESRSASIRAGVRA